MMQSTAKLVDGVRAVVDNGWEHSLVTDIPEESGGGNKGPTGLDLCVMALSSCLCTVFAHTAQEKDILLLDLSVVVSAKNESGSPTFTSATAEIFVNSPNSHQKLKDCLDITLAKCPVGLLFTKAGVKLSEKLIIE